MKKEAKVKGTDCMIYIKGHLRTCPKIDENRTELILSRIIARSNQTDRCMDRLRYNYKTYFNQRYEGPLVTLSRC